MTTVAQCLRSWHSHLPIAIRLRPLLERPRAILPVDIFSTSTNSRHFTSSRALAPMAASQPPWTAPASKADLPNLHVYNSLTRSKTPFIPIDPEGKKVTWYACGPTVYDDSHLGHARNYVSQDVLRRIMEDYFKFKVAFVMNITDVDDKIIVTARQQHLLSEFLAKQARVDDEVIQTTFKAFKAYMKKNLPLLGEETSAEDFPRAEQQAYGHILEDKSLEVNQASSEDKERIAKTKMHLNTARDAAMALRKSDTPLDEFGSKVAGVLKPYLDSLYAETVQPRDHNIFTNLTKRYERRFFDDMKALNVRYPDKVTRVTEYMPQITDFVKRIQDNGFAYENEGSIYYDTTAWEESGGYYARLEPWNKSNKELLADGEGSLSAKKTGFKKSGADFALWKASKTGEPSWSSAWGEGRPGWHIECSAMASDVLGKQFDIHSGGIDLAFPHHDNELAQSEAYWAKSGKESQQWVNYFLHMGHLGIAGAKMSKSLKNFTTIKEALDMGLYTPRSLRILFLLGAWKDGLEISTTPGVVSEANNTGNAWEEKVNNFFLKVRDIQMHPTATQTNGANGAASDLESTLETAKQKLHDALSDSFDTPAAMRIISELITAYNSTSKVPDPTSIAIGDWITEILVVFGLDADYRKGQMGWSGIDISEKAKPFVYPLSELRDKVREQAKSGSVDLKSLGRFDESETRYGDDQPYAKALAEFQRKLSELHGKNAGKTEYLAACDDLRDTVLWKLDIYLEDRDGRHALVRPLSASLRQERQDREAIKASKAAEAEKRKAEAAAKEKQRLEKGKLSHLEMFRTSEYTSWDDDGLPTKDAEGKDIAKARSKKLKKEWDNQKKLHEAWQAVQGE